MSTVEEAKELICDLCRNLYDQGHVSGTGGGISIRVDDQIVMAPSGVQKERMKPSDMFLVGMNGEVIEAPKALPPPAKPPKLSECAPLFLSAYELRNAGAVIHSHSINAFLATLLRPEASEFTVTQIEMIKGISGHGFYSNCVIPIIENTARECELTDRLREAIVDYPESNAVLVRRHGVYVWGNDWIHAKTQSECYEYLFECALRMHQLGLDASAPPPEVDGHRTTTDRPLKRLRPATVENEHPKAIVLDIEGTISPISYVTDVLYPYARQRLKAFMLTHYDTAEVQEGLRQIVDQANVDSHADMLAPSVPSPRDAPAEKVVECATKNCEWLMDQDRKATGLKTIQGLIWREGFRCGDLVADLYSDVPGALADWKDAGIKTYIFSSGSREAQKNLFSATKAGDLRPYLCGFFDTTSGPKTEQCAYQNIALSLGVDGEDILFATDNEKEAMAAEASGWRAVLAVRPGNPPLSPEATRRFRCVENMKTLLL